MEGCLRSLSDRGCQGTTFRWGGGRKTISVEPVVWCSLIHNKGGRGGRGGEGADWGGRC